MVHVNLPGCTEKERDFPMAYVRLATDLSTSTSGWHLKMKACHWEAGGVLGWRFGGVV